MSLCTVRSFDRTNDPLVVLQDAELGQSWGSAARDTARYPSAHDAPSKRALAVADVALAP